MLASAASESTRLRASLSPAAVSAARDRLLVAFLQQVADAKQEGGSKAAAEREDIATNAALQQQHALLRLMLQPAAVKSARAAAAAAALHGAGSVPTAGQQHAAAEALARFSLLRETAERCEGDAAQRTTVLLRQLVDSSHSSRGCGATAPGEEEQPPSQKRRRAAGRPMKQQHGRSADLEEDAPAAPGGGGGSASPEEKRLYGAVMCAARWGELVAVRSEAARQEASWGSLLERLRAQAEAAAAWIEPRAAAAAAAFGAAQQQPQQQE